MQLASVSISPLGNNTMCFPFQLGKGMNNKIDKKQKGEEKKNRQIHPWFYQTEKKNMCHFFFFSECSSVR